MSKVIGLHGKKQCGKDTACDFIVAWAAENGMQAEREGFADRLKISAARSLGFSSQEVKAMDRLKKDAIITVKWPDKKHGGPLKTVQEFTGREYLQWYGTEAHREVFDQDFWVNSVIPDPKDPDFGRDHGTDILVVTDVRFPNEAERIRECGGEVWHITRAGQDDGDGHASEKPLSTEYIDRRIYNDLTIEAYQKDVVSLCHRVLR